MRSACAVSDQRGILAELGQTSLYETAREDVASEMVQTSIKNTRSSFSGLPCLRFFQDKNDGMTVRDVCGRWAPSNNYRTVPYPS